MTLWLFREETLEDFGVIRVVKNEEPGSLIRLRHPLNDRLHSFVEILGITPL